MNKWLENDTVLRLISVGIAIVMWLTVTEASFPDPTDTLADTRIKNVQIYPKYDRERFELIQMTNGIELTLSGDKYALEHLPSSYRVYVDLTKLGSGKHDQIPVKVEGLPYGVRYKVIPETINVELEEKLQREMPVEVNLVGKVPDGYKVSPPIPNPSKVLVRGIESRLDQVKTVKATINLDETTTSIKKKVKLQVYGENGPLPKVQIFPEVAEVDIAINSPYKRVPLQIDVSKNPPTGYAIESIKPSTDQVTVYGTQSYIDALEYYVGPSLDLSNVVTDRTFQIPVPIRGEATKVEPKQVEIYVKMVPASIKKVDRVPIQITGVGQGLDAVILSPSNGQLNVSLSGAPNQLVQIGTSDIQAYVDVSNLPAGKHQVPIRFRMPSFIQAVGQTDQKALIELRPH
ncbi:CdaR family protein [Hazenella coriacea]|uniref:YbbR domain-containing protein n=1 Tax=Hazenella coriacea TaxID=1179467 RepID=A0A4R3L2W0_9BACL|nr:CdaR family protein [Hazenella coriacea]TCS93208.1 YbbR domain-containing protein [Hazenella coriacea]